MRNSGWRIEFALLALLLVLLFAAAAQAQQPAMRARAELGTSAAFAADGSLYAVRKQGDHVLLQRSVDNGRSWAPPVVVNAQPEAVSADGENRPKIAFAADGGVLVAWTHPLAKRFSGAIRLARSDDGRQFSEPLTVHRDRAEITHRFESMHVLPDGRVLLAWVDKRDLEARTAAGGDYRGAAIYAAMSGDGGRSFAPEVRVADHSCECCRIAVSSDAEGRPLLMWRHVFVPNVRDHALAVLDDKGQPLAVERATFDDWRIDACPHHGPSIAVQPDGTRHAVWFNERADSGGRVFYGRLRPGTVDGQRTVGGAGAAHADLAVSGARVAIAWKEFDGERTQLYAEVSDDGGRSFARQALAATAGASDQPRLIRRADAIFVFWRTEQDDMKVYPLP